MLTDFGVSKVLDEDMTQDLTGTAATVGTPEYMAPEQVTSKTVDHRADVYALGVVFFEMIAGRRPYEADTPMAVQVKHASAPPPLPKEYLPDLPDEFERVLIKAVQKDPANRYQNIADFAAALKKLDQSFSETIPPSISPEDRRNVESSASGKDSKVIRTAGTAPPLSEKREKSRPWIKPLSFSAGAVVIIGVLIIGLISGWFSGATQKQTTEAPIGVEEQEVPTRQVCHYQVRAAIVSPVVRDLADVGECQTCYGFCLAFKSFKRAIHTGLRQIFRADDLNCYLTLQTGIKGLINNSHPTFTEFLNELVAIYGGPG